MNKLSLYHLGQEHQRLFAQLYDPETGEINTEIEKELELLEPDTEKKCIAVASYIKYMESERKQIDEMQRELFDRAAAYEREIERKQNYLLENMMRCKIKEISCPYFTLRVKTNPYSTDVYDEKLIPENFMRTRLITKAEIKPDKEAIKKYVLKTNEQVPGATVLQKTKLQILIDKI